MGSIQRYHLSDSSTTYNIQQIIINNSNKLDMTIGLGEYTYEVQTIWLNTISTMTRPYSNN